MLTLRMKPQSSEDISGWASRLHQLDRGYKVTSRSAAFGTIVHMVKCPTSSFKLNQGSSRVLHSEVEADTPISKRLVLDLLEVGAIFPLPEATLLSLDSLALNS